MGYGKDKAKKAAAARRASAKAKAARGRKKEQEKAVDRGSKLQKAVHPKIVRKNVRQAGRKAERKRREEIPVGWPGTLKQGPARLGADSPGNVETNERYMASQQYRDKMAARRKKAEKTEKKTQQRATELFGSERRAAGRKP